MASQNRYRISKDYSEILKNFKQAETQAGVFIWYHLGEERMQQTARITKVDSIAKKIQLKADGRKPTLKANEYCYIKLAARDAVSKARVLANSELGLTLEFPPDMIFNENRSQKRYTFRPTDEKFVILQRAQLGSQHTLEKPVRLEVMNISKTGFALHINTAVGKQFSLHDKLVISTLNDLKLTTPISGRIIHCQEHDRKGNFGNEKGLKIGVMLFEPIPDQIFEQYIHNDRPIALDNERFFKDRIFRDSVHLNMSSTARRLGQNATIANAFKKLSVKRDGNTYLKNHIELLCEVTCEIGRALGWITEPNIEKLIYVSYLHDIHYFDRPYLARISSPRELELRRSELTEEDVKIFFEGPVYAAEIAKDDDRAAPDTHKILIQHRELPDGKGFPAGLKPSQMIPLSCLFVICHEFVDYVIETPDWTYKEFLRNTENTYKGMYFKKILQVFERLA